MSDGYRLVDNADLTTRNTFGVPRARRLLVEVDDARALPRVFADALADACADAPLLVLGGGSNLLFAGDAPGPVLALAARDVAIVSDDGRRTPWSAPMPAWRGTTS